LAIFKSSYFLLEATVVVTQLYHCKATHTHTQRATQTNYVIIIRMTFGFQRLLPARQWVNPNQQRYSQTSVHERLGS